MNKLQSKFTEARVLVDKFVIPQLDNYLLLLLLDELERLGSDVD